MPGVPAHMKRTPAQIAAEKPTPRNCINAFCFACQDDATHPHLTRFRVRSCTNKGCALWPVRGWQTISPRGRIE